MPFPKSLISKKNITRILSIGGILFALVFIYIKVGFVRKAINGIFYGKKIYLEQTVLSIKEVSEVSKWITAEYYGETLYSWKEHIGHEKEEAKENEEAKFVAFDNIKKDSMQQFYVWKDSAERWYSLMHQVLVAERKSKANFPQKDTLKKSVLFKDIQKLAGTKNEAATLKFIRKNPLHEKRYRRIRKKVKAKEGDILGKPKKDLVLLGRGWIKAGFDLDSVLTLVKQDKITETPRNDTLFISGMPEPEIIVSTINPWLIPGKVKGYEIVFKNKSGNILESDSKQVKVGCLKKLEETARENGLLEEAIVSAENSMLSMLQLLGNTKIKAVEFER